MSLFYVFQGETYREERAGGLLKRIRVVVLTPVIRP